jgi:hypothetical protein
MMDAEDAAEAPETPGEAPDAEDVAEGPEMAAEWRALLAIEGQATEDGRIIDVGALSWRDLPLSLMAMDETSAMGGHDGAKLGVTLAVLTSDHLIAVHGGVSELRLEIGVLRD